jgi:hypothetical protein
MITGLEDTREFVPKKPQASVVTVKRATRARENKPGQGRDAANRLRPADLGLVNTTACRFINLLVNSRIVYILVAAINL